MSRQVQELIDKIKSEGIEAARKKAGDVEREAKDRAGQIIDDAKKKAERIIADAELEAQKTQDATRAALKQSSRDMILSLKKEIQGLLAEIVRQDIKASLTPAQLAGIIETSVKSCVGEHGVKTDILISLSDDDMQKIKKDFIAKLQAKVKGGITFKPTDSINKGFTISFDKGKSSFDFTDESLAEFLTSFLNQEVAGLIKESVSG